jgi:predicted Zn-dependent peptidase
MSFKKEIANFTFLIVFAYYLRRIVIGKNKRMILNYRTETLDNGLRVIIDSQPVSKIATINILYNVGAKHENPELTGFAHLFEHLMFEGSRNVKSFDYELEKVGGTNNAFTNNDFTNYYDQIPVVNIETALWVESDRMMEINLTQEKFEIQKSVVSEEYKQRYLNQPFADAWLHIRPMAYKVHPYSWPTIGKDISHIENAALDDAKSFYNKFYNPCNAIVSISGGVDFDEAFRLVEKWFGGIKNNDFVKKPLSPEPKQMKFEEKIIRGDFPANKITRVWHMPGKKEKGYIPADMISDLLSNGKSTRFNQSLVLDKGLFTAIDAYITGDIDPGLFVVSGLVADDVDINDAIEAIDEEINLIKSGSFSQEELNKVKNKFESSFLFNMQTGFNKALSLAYYELLGDVSAIYREVPDYRSVDDKMIINQANQIFTKNNESRLLYLKTE